LLILQQPDVGGTWFENRYPGVMCDVPAHIYTLLDIPNPEWPAFYATGWEIQEYLTKIKKQYHLDRDVKYDSEVTEAIWDDKKGKWQVKINQKGNTITDTCDILINGSGVLNSWSWPKIPGLHDFKGHLSHSADWKTWADDVDFSGKRVGVIGNGSSGIQIVPEIAQMQGVHCTNIVREPTWISAPFAEQLSGGPPGTNKKYTEEEKEEFRRDPEKLKKYRHDLAHAFNHFYEALIEGSKANKEAMKATKEMMEDRLKAQPELIEKLVPKWSLGCRRLTPGNGYLESLTRDNVELVVGSIEKVTPKGVKMTDGRELEFDAIVCATGFDVSFRPRWLQTGQGGKSLAEEWKDDAQGYLSLCVSGYPNHFIFNG
jgi:cation diffusion facilitator CzcD-associated flavoprotein CzcO